MSLFNFKVKAESEIFGITSEEDLNDALEIILNLTKKIEDSELFKDGYPDYAKAQMEEIKKLFDSFI